MDSFNNGGSPVSHGSDHRPTIGFPLGTALLLLVIFSLSGVFSCCYHWDTLRRVFSRRAAGLVADGRDLGLSKPNMNEKQEDEGLPVIIMPGDNVPKFIALPCPCEPPRLEKVIVDPPPPPPPPPKPLR